MARIKRHGGKPFIRQNLVANCLRRVQDGREPPQSYETADKGAETADKGTKIAFEGPEIASEGEKTATDGTENVEAAVDVVETADDDDVSSLFDSDNDINDDIDVVDTVAAMEEGFLHVGRHQSNTIEELGGSSSHIMTTREKSLARELDSQEDAGEELHDDDDVWGHGYIDNDSEGLQGINAFDEDRSGARMVEFNEETDMRDPKFEKGQLFATADVLKKAIKQYGILNKVNVSIIRNEKERVNAKCKCDGWILRASINRVQGAFQIKKYRDKHTCGMEVPERYITYKWLAENYTGQFMADQNWSMKSFEHQLEQDYKTKTSKFKLWRAKSYSLAILRSSEEKQYSKLRDYGGEMRKWNPGSSVFIGCDNQIFQKAYVCIDACKRGFLAGCRPLIGLDGCWLKGRYRGQLLAAVGLDANDCIYPIAYGVVEVESKESWTWFLRNLADDLNIENSAPWTFMGDKEKGLVNSLDELFPNAEKRFCTRHLWKNLCRVEAVKKGKQLKDMLWAAAMATYPAEFNRHMEALKQADEVAWLWLKDKPAEQWSKSHFREYPKSDILLNNHNECFNSWILDARDQPILTMLETIRTRLMARFAMKRKISEKFSGKICPKILKKLEKYRNLASACWVTESGEGKYGVSSWHKLYAVDLRACTCTCRRWQLSGVPCQHAIACILHERKSPEDYIHDSYSIEAFKRSYQPIIHPLRDLDDYDICGAPLVKPPPLMNKKGKRQTVRRKTIDEQNFKVAADGTEVMSNKGSVIARCGKCGLVGHNRRRCDQLSKEASLPVRLSNTSQDGPHEKGKKNKSDYISELIINPSNEISRPLKSSQMSRFISNPQNAMQVDTESSSPAAHTESYFIRTSQADFSTSFASASQGKKITANSGNSSRMSHQKR